MKTTYYKTHQFTYLGKVRTIFTRKDEPFAKWYYRVRSAGRDVPFCLSTHEQAKAEKNAKEVIMADIAGGDKFANLRAATLHRAAATIGVAHTLAQLETAYRAATLHRLDSGTITLNTLSLRNIIRRAKGSKQAPESIALQILDADLIHAFKRNTLAGAADLDARKRRSRLRTANSILSHARSIFTTELQSSYRRDHNLMMPATLGDFLKEPGFGEVAKSQAEYRIPSDHLIRATFEALEKLQATNANAWLAIWLALGFGLRKEEIAGIRGRNLIMLNNVPHIELEEVWVSQRCKGATKNGGIRPRVACTNGAWPHLQPIFANHKPDIYVLTGTLTDRTENVFRQISEWMRTLGWETQKAVHEFRAYAGCQVAMRDGLYHASRWLRHSSICVTERNYGRYILHRVTDGPLKLPDVPAGEFKPVIAGAEATA